MSRAAEYPADAAEDGDPFALLRRAGLPCEVREGSPLRHVRTLPARRARTAEWPVWVPDALRAGYRQMGVTGLYTHQAEAAEALHAERHTVLATGTASGKSLGTQLAGLAAVLGVPAGAGPGATPGDPPEPGTGLRGSGLRESGPRTSGTVLYLSPTKALAADQLEALGRLAEAVGPAGPDGGIRPAAYDGDTEPEERRWVRQHANVVLSNPDMLNVGILPNHRAWARFLARLQYVILDEAHSYRGVFGSHIALLLRRLRRVARHYGGGPDGEGPVLAGASATSGDPAASFARLIGASRPESLHVPENAPSPQAPPPASTIAPRTSSQEPNSGRNEDNRSAIGTREDPVVAITEDGSPHGAVDVYLWESSDSAPQTTSAGHGAPLKRSLTVEAADVLTDLVVSGTRTLTFISSRRGAETIARIAAENLAEVDTELTGRVAAYRSGYLKEERRELESALRAGELLGVASTPALELGIDVSGLDAVVIAGWPGTRASFFQQLGRAGRDGRRGAAFFIAGDDPLDSYLLDHPEAIFDPGAEDAVTDPGNPHVAAPHLLAAAQELPLTPEDLETFEPAGRWLVETLTEQGHLRRRPRGWFFAHDDVAATDWVRLRSDGGGPYTIVEAENGAVIGEIGAAQVQPQAHPGAVYVHQGRSHVVDDLDLEQHTVLVRRADPPFYTQARETTSIEVLNAEESAPWGRYTLHFGAVEVTSTVVGFQRKALGTSEVLSDEPLELPPSCLRTKAAWITGPETRLADAGVIPEHVPGALHAAEHAMIGMLPLLTSGDRWDIGGVSTALHADTEQPTIFVYDGHPGGAGFAERGYRRAAEWIRTTADTIRGCPCESGCPSCVQSPKCGNRNSPLEKVAALRLLEDLLESAGDQKAGSTSPSSQVSSM